MFSLIAELSLGLLGFSGVAAAFGGRERAFNYVEKVRFFGIVAQSVNPLFGSLAIYVLSAAGFGSAGIISGAAGLSIFISLSFFAITMPAVTRSGRDASTSTETWAVVVVWIQMLVTTSLYALSILGGGVAWSLVAAYTCHLAMGVFIFWRILMRAE